VKNKRSDIILGAGGHAIEVADILMRTGVLPEKLCFFDNVNTHNELFLDVFPVLADKDRLPEVTNFFLGVGGIGARKLLANIGLTAGLNWIGLRAPSVIMGSFSIAIHENVDLLEGVTISSRVKIGKGTLINRGTSIHHDVSLGEYCELAPMVTLLGNVVTGNEVFIGSGATVLPNVRVGDGAVIGAGALVKDDVITKTTVVGIPARAINNKN
jgi:sugar O-acyltransferase (sialic acid O-acetyltransferase NeuD family)